MSDSPIRRQEKFNHLISKCLWGQEIDYDLHILAKINLIMHGDGYKNIKKGDTLKTDLLPKNYFDVVLMNPPFTIPYNDRTVLARYGIHPSRLSEEMDILFMREAILRLKPGKTLYTVLPEGMVNTKSYMEFREWLLDQGDLVLSISLPEGAFIPFGASVSKTCIVGIRKKDDMNSKLDCFVGRAQLIGFETGKKGYRAIGENNLADFLDASRSRFDGVLECQGKGECGWVDASVVSPERMDAGFLLNLIARDALKKNFEKVVRLGDVVDVKNIKITPSKTPNRRYRYFEVPAIGVGTGSLTNVRSRNGNEFTGTLHRAGEGDLIFVRINPRRNRVLVIPKGVGPEVVISPETHRLVLEPNAPIISLEVLAAIMRTKLVVQQTSRIGTGGSSSRSRVQSDDLLEEVFIPVPDETTQNALKECETVTDDLFLVSQALLDKRRKAARLLNDDISDWNIERL